MTRHRSAWYGVLLAGVMMPLAPPGQSDMPLLSRCHYRAGPDTVRALPRAMREISGLAFHRGLLLAHDDEQGRIYSINPASGAIGIFATMRGQVHADFEGIAVLGDTVWLMTSSGKLYGIKAAASSAPVAFTVHHTGLGKQCEMEGLAADQANGVLLLPCKTLGKNGREVVVYRWNLSRAALADPPAVRESSSDMKQAGAPQLHPSAIEVVPGTSHLLLLSSNPPALLELDSAGTPRGYQRLGPRHTQAEGLAIAPNGDLFISDEGGNGLATLSVYRCRP